MQTGITVAESRRSAQRARVLKLAELLTISGPIKIRVRDLTKSGARVFAGSVIPPGDLIMKCGETFVAARLTWSKGAEAGLQFYRDLTDEDLSKIAPLWLLREQQSRENESTPLVTS